MQAKEITLVNVNKNAMKRVAKLIASQLKSNGILALYGDLGAGKTFFTIAFCHYLGLPDYVSSPSYVLLNEYSNQEVNVKHFDLYRLSSVEEAFELGLPEIFSQDIHIIEWPDIINEILPLDTISIHFQINENQTRQLKVKSSNPLILSVILNDKLLKKTIPN